MLRTRAAQNDFVLALLLAEHKVAVLHRVRGLCIVRPGAHPAQAIAAFHVDGHARFGQHLGGAAICGHLKAAARLLQQQLKGLVHPSIGLGHAEVFAVQGFTRPAVRRGGFEYAVHEARCAAGVDMPTRCEVRHKLHQVGALAFVLEVVLHLVGPRCLGQVFQKARCLAAGRAVMKVKGLAQSVQAVRHGDHGCHADAACKQPAVRGVFVQRKVVGRSAHEHAPPLAKHPVHQRRAAAPARLGRLAQHA